MLVILAVVCAVLLVLLSISVAIAWRARVKLILVRRELEMHRVVFDMMVEAHRLYFLGPEQEKEFREELSSIMGEFGLEHRIITKFENRVLIDMGELHVGLDVDELQPNAECGETKIFIEDSVTDDQVVLLHILARVINHRSEMVYYADTDHLTKLCNGRGFSRELEKEFQRAQRYEHSLSLVAIDVDEFKHVNDNYSHAAGDIVLRDIAKILKTNTRHEIDLVARSGDRGDEFFILSPEINQEEAKALAEKIRQEVKAHRFEVAGGKRKFHVTISIGVASFPESGGDIEELKRKADGVLLVSKRAGRDKVTAAQLLEVIEQKRKKTQASPLKTV